MKFSAVLLLTLTSLCAPLAAQKKGQKIFNPTLDQGATIKGTSSTVLRITDEAPTDEAVKAGLFFEREGFSSLGEVGFLTNTDNDLYFMNKSTGGSLKFGTDGTVKMELRPDGSLVDGEGNAISTGGNSGGGGLGGPNGGLAMTSTSNADAGIEWSPHLWRAANNFLDPMTLLRSSEDNENCMFIVANRGNSNRAGIGVRNTDNLTNFREFSMIGIGQDVLFRPNIEGTGHGHYTDIVFELDPLGETTAENFIVGINGFHSTGTQLELFRAGQGGVYFPNTNGITTNDDSQMLVVEPDGRLQRRGTLQCFHVNSNAADPIFFGSLPVNIKIEAVDVAGIGQHTDEWSQVGTTASIDWTNAAPASGTHLRIWYYSITSKDN